MTGSGGKEKKRVGSPVQIGTSRSRRKNFGSLRSKSDSLMLTSIMRTTNSFMKMMILKTRIRKRRKEK